MLPCLVTWRNITLSQGGKNGSLIRTCTFYLQDEASIDQAARVYAHIHSIVTKSEL